MHRNQLEMYNFKYYLLHIKMEESYFVGSGQFKRIEFQLYKTEVLIIH